MIKLLENLANMSDATQPFDDVAPDGGPDQSGAVMGSPAQGGFTVAVGGIGAYA